MSIETDGFFVEVALKTSFNSSILTYKSSQPLVLGMMVNVPLRKKVVQGIVCDLGDKDSLCRKVNDLPDEKILAVDSLAITPLHLSSLELEFFQWIAKYYHYPLGLVIFEALPRQMKKIIKARSTKGKGEDLPFPLSFQQQLIVNKIRPLLGKGFNRFLIHGITGSGKTVIYLQLMQKILAMGKSVLFLVPEINLTPQLIHFFSQFIEGEIFSYHSDISNSEKYALWVEMKQCKTPCVILGVRSAIFLPIWNLGLIVVDEEHDSSFKQDERCPYNARDLAIKKAQLSQIPLLLGSATPSMETFHYFVDKECYFPLPARIGDGQLPAIKLISIIPEKKGVANGKDDLWPLRPENVLRIQEALAKNEQVIVFVNRLGYSNFLQCYGCGHHFTCPNCSCNLRFFKKRRELSCAICGFSQLSPTICPTCSNVNLQPRGFGTEKIEAILQQQFPNRVVKRFDRDEIKNFQQLQSRLAEFHQGQVDILVGTQMLSKGHNFARVNLVIVLGIDAQLNYPDFRANERVYQLLKQISGRAGRFATGAQVHINSLSPENSLFNYIEDGNLGSFYLEELNFRSSALCPPFSKFIVLYVFSKDQNSGQHASWQIKELLVAIGQHFPPVEILGPRPGIVEKRVNQYMWSILLKSTTPSALHNMVANFQKNYVATKGISFKIDVDPYTLF